MIIKIGVIFILSTAITIVAACFSTCEQLFQYDAHGKHDPFVPLIGKEKPSIVKLENITSIEDVRLEGIANAAKGRIAILNGELVKENDKFGEVIIKRIAKRAVTITIEGKEHVITLPEEGGFKE